MIIVSKFSDVFLKGCVYQKEHPEILMSVNKNLMLSKCISSVKSVEQDRKLWSQICKTNVLRRKK